MKIPYKICLGIIVLIIILSLSLVYSAGGINKLFDPTASNYGKVTLKQGNSFLASYTLLENSDLCMINCYAEGIANFSIPSHLFMSIRFLNTKTNLNKNINYQFYIVTESLQNVTVQDYETNCTEDINPDITNSTKIKTCTTTNSSHVEEQIIRQLIPYNNELLSPGVYKWRIEGQKNYLDDLDWIVTVNQNIEITEWAQWQSGFNTQLKMFYNFEDPNTTKTQNQVNSSYDLELRNYTIPHFVSTIRQIYSSAHNFSGSDARTNYAINNTISGIYFGNSVSIQAWIYVLDDGGSNRLGTVTELRNDSSDAAFANKGSILALQRSSLGVYGFIVSNGTNEDVANWSENHSVYTTSNLSSNTWHHLVGVYNGTALLIYANGKLNNTQILDGIFGAYGNIEFYNVVNTTLTIGASALLFNLDESYWFNGTLDDIAYWNRSLSATEISDLYNAGSGLNFSINDYPTVITNSTIPATLIHGLNDVYINLTIYDANNDTLSYVNFTITKPNATILINNINSTKINDVIGSGLNEEWHSITFNISSSNDSIGTWNWSVNILDSAESIITYNGDFIINDILTPNITISYPSNNTIYYQNKSLDINFSIIDDIQIQWCAYSTDNGITNNTINNCYLNTSVNFGLLNNTYNFTLFANDTSGNLNILSVYDINITFDITAPTINISRPANGSIIFTSASSYIYNLNYSVSDLGGVESCYYNVSYYEDNINGTEVSTTKLGNCNNATFVVTRSNYNYELILKINDTTGNYNYSYSTFRLAYKQDEGTTGGGGDSGAGIGDTTTIITDDGDIVTGTIISFNEDGTVNVDTDGDGIADIIGMIQATGGGAAGGGGPIIVEGKDVKWSVETEQGSGAYVLSISPGEKRIKNIIFKNLGENEVIIGISCEGDLCGYMKLKDTSITLPVAIDVPTISQVEINIPSDFANGKYISNIAVTDNEGNKRILTLEVNVGGFAAKLLSIINKLTQAKLLFGAKIPYAILFILISAIVFSLFNFIIFREIKEIGLALSVIISLIGGVVFLIFL